ncbi:hypothetical protein DMC30DRAFT_39632 [Rhodotorula diobovata]|uniref:Uncharacterized protein n=1 Tax=Rhodotorula diobovata TaxID=5288 RepID=A0A5C5FPE5_9BASI|nr:hypothetical protein DMC30DRAFT_39632 [Rhodotorula diobovata]
MTLQAPSPWRPPSDWQVAPHLRKTASQGSTTVRSPSSEPAPSPPSSFLSSLSSLALSSPSSSPTAEDDSPDATRSAPGRLSNRSSSTRNHQHHHPKRPAVFTRRSTSALATVTQRHQDPHCAHKRVRPTSEAGAASAAMGGELANWMDAMALAGRQAQARRDGDEPGGS